MVDMLKKTRRKFLQLSACTVAANTISKNHLLWGSTVESGRSVKLWITSDTQKFAQVEAPQWKVAASASGKTSDSIHIDPSIWYQEILGFGAALTDASCYLFSQLNAKDRKALLEELFGPEGLKFSIGRICIGSSDYSTSVYSYDESPQPDPDLKNFSIEHDRAYILPALRTVRQINPELYFFSAPWSPPGWMKPNNSMLGGSMNKIFFASYAQYFVKFIQSYAAEGVKVNATSVQNEVDTDQNATMPACIWAQQDEVVFVKDFLGPAIENASLDTKIWILDHNYNLWGRVLDQLSDPDLCRYVDGVAWHAYQGTADAMTRVHNAFPNQHAYWTEGGAVITSPDFERDWSKWSQAFTGVLKNWGRAIVGWNIALDEEGKPNMGLGRSGGIVTIHSKTQKITRCGQYWAFAHYSKVMQRGARVLASDGNLTDIDHVAVENPDGSHVLVLTNHGGLERLVPCKFGTYELEITMPKNSVATLLW